MLTPGEAYEVTRILEGVITKGTGAGYTSIGCRSEAGKTGTTDGLSDAWFVGYTPLYSTAVWTGHPLSRSYTGFGGPTSGPIWRSYMEAAQGHHCPDFPVPAQLPALSRAAQRPRRLQRNRHPRASPGPTGLTPLALTPSATPTPKRVSDPHASAASLRTDNSGPWSKNPSPRRHQRRQGEPLATGWRLPSLALSRRTRE